MKIGWYFTIIAYFFNFSFYAQATDYWLGERQTFDEGFDLFEKKMYGASQQKMSDIVKSTTPFYLDASYYSALSSNQLLNKDAEYYGIDTWEGSPEYVEIDFKEIEKSALGRKEASPRKNNIHFIKKQSVIALPELVIKNIMFSVINKFEFVNIY